MLPNAWLYGGEQINKTCISRVVLPYKSVHNNRDIFYDEMVLIFIYEHHCKTSCEKVECWLVSDIISPLK